jgi:cytochrome d ubiquinol oxidase subunit I
VTGLDQLQAQYRAKYGPGNYIPNVAIQYWSMRTMAGLGSLLLLFALWGGWLLGRGKLRTSRLFLTMSVWAVVTPFLMNTAGWLLTESGRQPWIAQGLQKTVNANSPSVSTTEIWISLSAFVLAYIVLGAADLVLMLRYSRHGLAEADAEAADSSAAAGSNPAPVLTY